MYNALKKQLRQPYYSARNFVATRVRKYIPLRQNADFVKQVEKAIPDLHKTRALLGKKAYNYIQSIIHTPGQTFERTLHRIAEFLCHAGLPDEGLAVYETLLKCYGTPEQAPEALIVSYLQLMMFGSPEVQTNERIYQQHVYWSSRFASGKVYKDYPNPPLEGRRLKIGYTCHFITNPVSTNSLQPMLKAHSRDRVEVFFYSDEKVNEKTDSVRNVVEHWRDTYGMNADAFCELVRKDGIDILVELNGHGVFHRYYEIARHPVPVQVTMYNYCCTTGVPGMDYALTPGDYNIEALQSYYSETIFHKEGQFHAVPIGNYYPPLTESPFEKNGFITFCSFGQAHKVSRQQIHLWCEILKRVPRSKFFMKAQVLGEPANRAAFIHHFKDGGIDQSRLILEGNSDHATLLKCYWRTDIALDTYPANAGTTSIEATMQGVPVISLTGERYSSQVGQAIVGAAGNHPELQCQSPQEFIEKAVSLAKDKQKLSHYRQTMRSDFVNSPRNNMDAYMAEMEDAYFAMWQRYADAHGKESAKQHRADQ